jgi:hypothetical protein
MEKTFMLTITKDDGGIRIKGENRGFDAFELLGLLQVKVFDIAKQLSAMQEGGSPGVQIERIVIKERRMEKKNDAYKNKNRKTNGGS